MSVLISVAQVTLAWTANALPLTTRVTPNCRAGFAHHRLEAVCCASITGSPTITGAASDAADTDSSTWNGAIELPGTTASQVIVRTAEHVSVRVLRWMPDDEPSDPNPVVVVAGWGSIFDGWRPLVAEWAKTRKIIYIETREKKSGRFDRRPSVADFAMENHGDDIAKVLKLLGVESSKVDWFSSSLGATLLLDAFQARTLSGRSSVMLAPNPSFSFPFWARPILRLPFPRAIYARLRGLGMWVVRRKTKEPAQRARYERSLASQDLERLVLSMKANLNYKLPEDCGRVDMPCAVLAATSDTLHGMDKISSVVDRLPDATLIEVPSSQYAHEAVVLEQINGFYAELAAR